MAISIAALLAVVPIASVDAAPDAPAPPPAAEPEARAVELFERSEAAYKAGRFAETVELLQQAYALRSEPILLYDLARAYEGLGDLARAIDAYQRYLVAAPAAKNRDGIVQRIATLRAQVAERDELERSYRVERKKLEIAQARARYRAAEDTQAAATLPPKVTIGVGGGTLLVGVALALLASARQNDARDKQTSQLATVAALSDARTFATSANVCFAAGGALAIGGLAWLLVARARTGPPDAPAPLIAPRVAFTGSGFAW